MYIHMHNTTLSRRGSLARFATLVLSLVLLCLVTTSPANARRHKRDAFTNARGTRGDTYLESVGRTPAGAYARSLPVTPNSQIFTWYSKTPHNESSAESAFIVIHGINRNAHTYWTILNNAWAKARDAALGSAKVNSIRVAPLFFSRYEDEGVYNKSQLAWGDSNAWAAGEPSTHPMRSSVSSFAVLDSLLLRFSNKTAYPNMQYITFLAHGGGSQLVQRYAVMGLPNPDPTRLSIRYVVGDPSSELYFTGDRPVGVDKASCPTWNDYRYGVQKYSTNYGTLNSVVAPALFKAYAAKEVRYIVGLNDTSPSNGDQTCMAHAVGGIKRRNRNLAYWKYIHLLSGYNPDNFTNFPGTFPALDPKYGATNQTNIPKTGAITAKKYQGTTLIHTLTTIMNVGHSASKVYGSEGGMNALFSDQASSGSGTVPDFSQELVGFTANASGAKKYATGDVSEDD